MAKPSKFAHIVYRTKRFEEMIVWYEKVFEARVQYKNLALAFLTYDDEHHRFAFANLEVLDPSGKVSGGKTDVGVDHVAYTYASLRDLVDTYTRLKKEGIRPYWPNAMVQPCRSTTKILTETESSFRSIVVVTADEANAYMRGDGFSSNPIGVNFDPDELVEEFKKGVPEQQLLARPEGPPASIPREHGLGA